MGAVFALPLARAIKSSAAQSDANAVGLPAAAAQTYVLVGVDSLAGQTPLVEAVWLAEINAARAQIKFVGLPPFAFRHHFTPETGVPLSMVQPYLGDHYAGSVVVDRADMIELVDRADGLLLLGRKVNGADVGRYLASAEDERAILMAQAAVLQSAVARLATNGARISILSMIESISYMTMQSADALNVVKHFYPLNAERVVVQLALP